MCAHLSRIILIEEKQLNS